MEIKLSEYARLVREATERATLKSLVFHSPTGGDILKIKGTLKEIGGQVVLQLESSMTEGRVSQVNLTSDKVESTVAEYLRTFKKSDLYSADLNASLMISKKGKVSLLSKRVQANEAVKIDTKNDRQKNRALTGEEPFLIELGVSDKNGRVHDKKQSKFRQIARFSEYIMEAEKKLPRRDPLYVCDLCCGKSYLSFAAYHVLTELCGRQVEMACVDLKQSVMDYCSEVARNVGMDGMHFYCQDIATFKPQREVDLVISLHACDTATDIVLNFAMEHNARSVLSTPCCHHQMNREMDCPTLAFIADRPVLRQKLATAATDALRLLKLESYGYKVDATEFIDPEDTPKNVMLRANKRPNFNPDSPEAAELREKYKETYKFMYGKYPD